MKNLLPCPFCGSEAVISEHAPKIHGNFQWMICCENNKCPMDSVRVSGMDTKETAIKAWNTRFTGWISVNDRFPDEEQIVLAFNPMTGVNQAVYKKGKYTNGFRMVAWGEDEGRYTPYVDYWMTLPDANPLYEEYWDLRKKAGVCVDELEG